MLTVIFHMELMGVGQWLESPSNEDEHDDQKINDEVPPIQGIWDHHYQPSEMWKPFNVEPEYDQLVATENDRRVRCGKS
jgi:hypothetical protein